jgi:hypothetical protein
VPFSDPLRLADLRIRLADRYDGQPFWSPDDARDAINQTLIWWNLLTGVWRRSESVVLTANNWDYALTASLTYPLRVELDGRPLTPSSIVAWDYIRPGWRTQTTAAGGEIPNTVEEWAPVSLSEIAVWPAPAGAGAGTLILDGVAVTPVLDAELDTLVLNESWLAPILGMAVHLLTFSLRGPRWQATKVLRQQFLAAALDQNDQLGRSRLLRTYAGLDQGKLIFPRGGAGQDGQGSGLAPVSTDGQQTPPEV